MVLTRELERMVRESENDGVRYCVASMQALRPDIGACTLEIAGGLSAYTGSRSPLSQAYGIACDAEVSADDVLAIDEFFASRNTAPAVFVSPYAHQSLARELVALRYVPKEHVNVFVCDLAEVDAALDVRVTGASDLFAWASASTLAFRDNVSLSDDDDLVAHVIARSKGVVPLQILVDGSIVATAAMDVQGAMAGVFGGSTVPGFRNQGFQLALLRDRLARAKDAGARYARGAARCGSASERNFIRAGFRAFYTIALWERELTG